jgi:nickel/cobalt transporter (NicO) family protein
MPRRPTHTTNALLVGTIAVALAVSADALLHQVMAQANPFGAPRPAAAPPQAGGVFGWMLAKQSEFYRQLSAAIRAAKTDGSALWTLLGLSFLYGIFHAAGPGHGKAVISSYLLANEETARRGIVLSFVSAMLQAVVAVVLVGIAAWLLNATAKAMCSAEYAIEIASYLLIAALGARLMWVKGRGLWSALQWRKIAAAPGVSGNRFASLSAASTSVAGFRCDATDEPGHVHDASCGHAHGPEPEQLAGPGGWQRGLSAVLAVGIRPCSGAILVLVFAMAQGLFAAGVAATFAMALGTAITVASIAILAVTAKGLARKLSASSSGGPNLILRGLELGAAAVVLLFGVGLMLGVIASERGTCL